MIRDKAKQHSIIEVNKLKKEIDYLHKDPKHAEKVVKKMKVAGIKEVDPDKLLDEEYFNGIKKELLDNSLNNVIDKLEGDVGKMENNYLGRLREKALISDVAKKNGKAFEIGDMDSMMPIAHKLNVTKKYEYAANLYKIARVGRKRLWKNMEQDYLDPTFFAKLNSTPRDKFDAIAAMARRDGNKGLYDSAMHASRRFDMLMNFKKRYADVWYGGLRDEMLALSDDQQVLVKDYIKNISTERLGEVVVNGKKRIADTEIHKALDEQTLDAAHKLVNFFRMDIAQMKEISEGGTQISHLVGSHRQINPYEVKDATAKLGSKHAGDLGINYFPRQASPEGEAILQKNWEKYHNPDYDTPKTGGKASLASSKVRTRDSFLDRNPEYEMGFIDVLDKFASEKRFKFIRNTMTDEVNTMAIHASEDILGNTILKGKKQFDPVMNKYKQPLTALQDHLDMHFAPTAKAEGLIGGTFEAFMKASVAAALSSTKAITFNLPQTINNMGAFVGYLRTAKEYGFTLLPGTWAMGKGIVKPWQYKESMDSLIRSVTEKSRNSADVQYSMLKYMENYSNLVHGLTGGKTGLGDVPLAEAMGKFAKAGFGKKFDALINYILMPYQTSDTITRLTGGIASAKKAEDVWTKYGAETLSGKEKIIDELFINSLGETYSHDIKQFLVDGNKREFIAKYTEASVNKGLYDYRQKPELLDKVKDKPVLRKALLFSSWNMYYMKVLDGALTEYANGNTAPINKMLMYSMAWFAGFSAASGSEDPMWAEWAAYGMGRTPVVMPTMGLYGKGFDTPFGFAGSALAIPLYFTAGSMKWVSESLGGRPDSLDYVTRESKQQIFKNPVVRGATKIVKGIDERLLGD